MMESLREVFISYSWDHEFHKDNVLAFCNFLRANGFHADVDVALSQLESAVDFYKMMYRGIAGYKKVIIVLSEGYKQKAESFLGGVGQEYELIIKDIDENPNKYILVSFTEISDRISPLKLRSRETIYLNNLNPNNLGARRLFAKLMDAPMREIGPVAP